MRKIFILSFAMICLFFTACSSKKKDPVTLRNDLRNAVCQVNGITSGVGSALGVSGVASGNGVISSSVPLSPAQVGSIVNQTAQQQAAVCAESVERIMALYQKAHQQCFNTLTQVWNNAVNNNVPYVGTPIANCPNGLTNFLLQVKTTLLSNGVPFVNTQQGQQWLQNALISMMPNGQIQPSQYPLAMNIFQQGIMPYLGGGLSPIVGGIAQQYAGGGLSPVITNNTSVASGNNYPTSPVVGGYSPVVTGTATTLPTSPVVFGLTNRGLASQVVDLSTVKK